MSDKKKDGGPAFPMKHKGFNRTDSHIEYVHMGLSLRDYFAAKALPALLGQILSVSEGDLSVPFNMVSERASADAYKVADAMLAAREES